MDDVSKTVCVGMGGAKGMAGMAMPIPLLGALWPRMAFALCCLVFRLQWRQNLINNINFETESVCVEHRV